MPVLIDDTRIRIGGDDYEPAGLAWLYARPEQRREHWRTVGNLAVRRIRNRLRLGRDKDGRPLARLRTKRPDGADGPPLTPHRAESRFSRYLRVSATPRGCVVFWGHGWAKVVRGHKLGWGALPVRDVVGLTRADERYIRAEARAVWARKHGGPIAGPPPGSPAPRASRRPRPSLPPLQLPIMALGRPILPSPRDARP